MSVLLAALLALAQGKQDPVPVRITYDDTLRFGTADGSFEGQLGGFIRVHGRAIHDRPDDEALPVRVLPDSLYLRQARIETAGTYSRDWGYRLSADFRTVAFDPATDAVERESALRDAWFEWKRHPAFVIRFGQYFAPCTGEEMSTSRHMEFADRNPLVRLMPGRELGLEVYGSLLEDDLRYFVMVSNGGALVNDQGRSVSDSDDEKELSGVVFVRPLPFLRLGAGGSVSSVDDLDAREFDLVTTELIVQWLESTAGTFDGRRRRLDLSLLAHGGPASLRAELLWRRDELKGSPEDELRSGGWALSASWLVTGEEKVPDRRPSPASEWGALEAALRVSRVRVPNAFESGLAGPGNSEGVTACTLAATWWIGRHLRLSLDVVRELYDDPLDFDTRSEDALTGLVFRGQADF